MRHSSKDEDTRAKRKVTASPLFDGMIDGAAFVDAETKRVLLANRSAAAMFGFESPDEMVGLDPMNHIPEEDRARMAGIMAGYFVEGGTQKTMEVRAIARDGREVWVLGSGVRTHYEGRLAGIIFVKDITAQKAAEKALAEAEERQADPGQCQRIDIGGTGPQYRLCQP